MRNETNHSAALLAALVNATATHDDIAERVFSVAVPVVFVCAVVALVTKCGGVNYADLKNRLVKLGAFANRLCCGNKENNFEENNPFNNSPA